MYVCGSKRSIYRDVKIACLWLFSNVKTNKLSTPHSKRDKRKIRMFTKRSQLTRSYNMHVALYTHKLYRSGMHRAINLYLLNITGVCLSWSGRASWSLCVCVCVFRRLCIKTFIHSCILQFVFIYFELFLLFCLFLCSFCSTKRHTLITLNKSKARRERGNFFCAKIKVM